MGLGVARYRWADDWKGNYEDLDNLQVVNSVVVDGE